MIPYRDENETQRPAIVTAAIIAVNFLVWIVVQGAGSDLAVAKSVCELGLIPGAHVSVTKQEPFGGPIVVRADGADHPISRELAARIGVE